MNPGSKDAMPATMNDWANNRVHVGFSPVLSFLLGLTMSCGCATRYYEPAVSAAPPNRPAHVIRPVIAVTDFENKSGFSGSWNLGSGMADVLITELLDTEKVEVLERKHLGDVMSEINLQGNEMFRKEGKVTRGRLKTARYLIRGSVTDFTVTRDASGWFGVPSARIFGRGQSAKVTLHAMLIDVESGEVIGSVKSSGSAGSGLFGGSAEYKKMNFGGEVFFRTPLGKATERAMRNVIHEILRTIPAEYWRPVVAEVIGPRVILNGGKNVGMQVGSQYRAMASGRVVTDPLTGEVIERQRGSVKGWVLVTDVLETSSHGRIVEGYAERGDRLEPTVFQ